VYEPIDRELCRRYGIAAPLAAHYLAPAAIAQKIGALAHRTETQARDVFDLELLFTTMGAVSVVLDEEARSEVPRAIERAMGVSFDEFAGHVLAFLADEHRILYESRPAWEQLQAEVVGRLEELLT